MEKIDIIDIDSTEIQSFCTTEGYTNASVVTTKCFGGDGYTLYNLSGPDTGSVYVIDSNDGPIFEDDERFDALFAEILN